MFIQIPKVRDIEIFDTVSDIKAHLDKEYNANFFVNYAGKYFDEREFGYDEIGTWAHENCHQINSNVRNKESVKSNCAYWLDSRAYVRPEIKTVKLNDVAKAVPEKLKGNGYNLYMIQQQRYWNNEPLYIIDELSCYRVGTKARIENGERPDYSCSLYIEFCGYLAVLIKITQEYIPLINVAMAEAFDLAQQMDTKSKLLEQVYDIQEYIDGP